MNRVINELTELLVTNAAMDPDIPPNHLSYQFRQSGIIAMSWGSVVGIVYRVEFKDCMEDPQRRTLEEVLAISSQCAGTDEARGFQLLLSR